MTYKPFDVLVVPFPFTDSAAVKRRPALVLSAEQFQDRSGHLVCAMITSRENRGWPLDVEIAGLKSAGLSHASVVRMRLFTLDERFVLRRAGRLGARIAPRCSAVWNCCCRSAGFRLFNPGITRTLLSLIIMKPRTLSVLLAVFTFALAARAELASSPAEVKPLPVGAKVPAALVKSVEGADVSLVDLVGLKPTVLIFYRGSWCPYCNRHLAALNEVEPELLKLGFQILAISPDDLPGLRSATEKNHLNYRLFSDQGMQASAAFGLAFRVDAKTIQAYTGYGISLAAVPGEPDARWLPVPAVYIIGRDGEVKFVHSNPDYKARLTTYQVMTAAKAAL